MLSPATAPEMLVGISNVTSGEPSDGARNTSGVLPMSIGLFRKRTEYTAVALHLGVFPGYRIYIFPRESKLGC